MRLVDVLTLIKDHFILFSAVTVVIWLGLTISLLRAAKGQSGQRPARSSLQQLKDQYRHLLTASIGWATRSLSPETLISRPAPADALGRLFWRMEPLAQDADDVNRLQKTPWSWPVLSVAALLALIYPSLFAFLQWLVTGQSSSADAFLLLSETVSASSRLTMALMILAPCLAPLLVLIPLDRGPKTLQTGLTIFAYLSFALLLIWGLTLATYFAEEGLFAIGFLTGVLCAAVMLRRFRMTSVIGFVATLFFAMLFIGGDSSLSGGAVFLTVICAVLFPIGVSILVQHLTRMGLGVAAHLARLLGVVVASIWVLSWAEIPELIGLVLALFFLPCVNALFDWLSYGMTIFLLRTGQAKRGVWPFLCGVADVVAAGVIFAALAASLVALLAQINLWRGDILVDVRAILDQPSAHLWVIAMIASTLVPTLVHLGLALCSLITWVPVPFWQKGVDRLLDQEDTMGGWWAAARLSGALVGVYGGFLLLGGAVLWALWQFGAMIVSGYVGWLHVLLDWIRQPVLPVVT